MLEVIQNNLLAFPVILPLLGSLLCVLFRKPNLAWLITLVVTILSFLSALKLLHIASAGVELKYALSSFAAPETIDYKLDILSAGFMFLISATMLVILPFAKASLAKELGEKKLPQIYAVLLLCAAGLTGMVATNDLFNIYVFLEISSLATYTLIGTGYNKKAPKAGYDYLIIGTIGATFILIGIGFIYAGTGSLNISDIASRIHQIDPNLVTASMLFFFLGFALKLAIFPLHNWLTNSYAYAPTAVSAFLSATATKVVIYLAIRLYIDVYNHSLGLISNYNDILVMVAVASVIIGSLSAIAQNNIKRSFAFSSIAQIGYIILLISIATIPSINAGIIHIFNHAMAKALIFLAIGAVVYRRNHAQLNSFKGIAKDMPLTIFAFLVGGLSIVGIPGTAGFISKWKFIEVLIGMENYYLLALVLFSSILAIIYVWRVVEVAFFEKAESHTKEAPLFISISLIIGIFLNLYFGFFPEEILNLSSKITEYIAN